jgi:hypothetical protein
VRVAPVDPLPQRDVQGGDELLPLPGGVLHGGVVRDSSTKSPASMTISTSGSLHPRGSCPR